MNYLLILPLLGLIAGSWSGQDGTDARKEIRTKLSDLRKTLGSSVESERIAAISELGSILEDEARSMLASRLSADSEAVRIAASKAIAKHKHSGSANSIGAAIDPNAKNEPVLRAFIDALEDLDMCAGLPVLVAMLEVDTHDLAEQALKAIARIGCPEAAQGLINLLREAEVEAREPDRVPDPRYRNQGRNNRRPTRGTPYRSNPGKDQQLAKLAPKVKQTLSAITGQSFSTVAEWESWLRASALKLASIYLCETDRERFEIPSGKSKKCPHEDDKKGHKDTFLKHRRE